MVLQRSINGNPYVKNYEFQYNFQQWGQCSVTMTSVLGHLTSQDFDPRYKSWKSCEPSQLFEATIETYVEDSKKPLAKNIETQARYNQILYIWTDCDREGENIGVEIRTVAMKGNARLNDPGNTVRALSLIHI